jgi:DNA-binding transcriptional LysR family regulator
MNLDLRMVRYAVAVADELHFGRAAARLMITEQTLSAQIKKFEAMLGLQFFVRDRRRVELTAAGEVLVERGRRLLAETDDLLAAIAQNQPPVVIDVLAEGITPGVIAQHLRSELRGMPVETRQGQGLAACLPRVLSGEVDVAFGRVRGIGGSIPRGIASTLVRLEPMGVALPVEHPLAEHPEVRLAELAEVPILVHSAHEAVEWRNWQEDAASAFGLQITVRVHGHGASSANAAVLSYRQPGMGTLFRPGAEGVVMRPLIDPIPLYPWSAVWRASRRDGRIPEILPLIRQFVSDQGWLDPPEEPWWVPDADRDDIPQRPGRSEST